ncbi:LCP family protein [Yinghuangia soli]|uniref:LCP family protein n=1 Tax=Yinghuangia soli TaxID=2908204 RepID=A0AA41U864_9ACTN|nr:LCP family protein [Yinghuangia soli]MCF2532589.1 LCP family protein [Yinghuangia soli]
MQEEHQEPPAAAGHPETAAAAGGMRPGRAQRRRTLRTRRRKRILVGLAAGMAVLLLALGGIGWWIYDRLNGNIKTEDFAAKLGESERPAATNALNILLVGTDSRSGDNAQYGSDPGDTQRSDTTILLHVPEGRKSALGVSFPRDLMVEVPACQKNDGTMSRPYFGMFNSAMEVGGTACTIKTVEQLTDVRIDHQITVDFTGFKKLVDALGGVPMHLDKPIDDKAAKLQLPAGDVTLDGEQALGFVRARKSIGDGSDIQRIERQQQFLTAMVDKVKKESLLTSPTRLYGILDAATKAITTDPGLGSLSDLYDLLTSLKNMPQSAVKFETVPITTYTPDPNRVALLRPEADVQFARLRDESAAVVPTPADAPADGSSSTPSPGRSGTPSPTATAGGTYRHNG